MRIFRSQKGIGLTILVIVIAVGSIVVGASARGFENMARQTQLRIDQTKAHYLAQAGVMRAVWKWYTNNDVAVTNEIARRWTPIDMSGTPVVGNNFFKAGMDSSGTYLQSNFAYIVPGIALVKNVVTAASNSASTATLASAAIGTTVPVGNFLVVYAALDAVGTAPTALDSKGNAYTRRVECANAANNNVVRVAILSAPVTVALTTTDTITLNWTTSVTAKAFTVAEFSGVDSFDATVNAWGCNNVANANPSTSPTVTMTASTGFANELIIGAIGVEGSVADAFTAGTNYLESPPTRTGIGVTTAGCLIRPEYRIVNAAAAYTANGTITSRDWAAATVGFYAANRWITSVANRRLAYWQIYNTHTVSNITLTHVKVSWTGGGAARVNDFVLNGVSKWPGGTSATGATIDITDTALTPGSAWQGPNTYIQWDNNGPADPTTITCQFFFSGDTVTSDAKSHEVVMWNGLRANGAGIPGDRAFTVVATGQVNQTSPAFKVLKTIKAKVSGAPATAAAPAVAVMEITEWDEGDKNIP